MQLKPYAREQKQLREEKRRLKLQKKQAQRTTQRITATLSRPKLSGKV
jgi:hypothetical protein